MNIIEAVKKIDKLWYANRTHTDEYKEVKKYIDEYCETRLKHSKITKKEVLFFADFLDNMSNHESIGSYGAGGEVWCGTPGTHHFDINRLCFVHGSIEDLLKGKVCVVRDEILHLYHIGGNEYYDTKLGGACKVFHINDKEKLFIIGRTHSGNTKLRYKKFD